MNTSVLNLKYETFLWKKGIKIIAGVDEVGRGSLAGPLVAAAVAWDHNFIRKIVKNSKNTHPIFQIKDSKKLTIKKREELSSFIIKNSLDHSIVKISSKKIDASGVGKINKIALRKAAYNIKHVEHILVDYYSGIVTQGGNTNSKNAPAETPITKGDCYSLSIASASIIAKVYRDNLMKRIYHRKFPLYGFDTNVGYGTKKHIEAIKKYGICEIHRETFCNSIKNA